LTSFIQERRLNSKREESFKFKNKYKLKIWIRDWMLIWKFLFFPTKDFNEVLVCYSLLFERSQVLRYEEELWLLWIRFHKYFKFPDELLTRQKKWIKTNQQTETNKFFWPSIILWSSCSTLKELLETIFSWASWTLWSVILSN